VVVLQFVTPTTPSQSSVTPSPSLFSFSAFHPRHVLPPLHCTRMSQAQDFLLALQPFIQDGKGAIHAGLESESDQYGALGRGLLTAPRHIAPANLVTANGKCAGSLVKQILCHKLWAPWRLRLCSIGRLNQSNCETIDHLYSFWLIDYCGPHLATTSSRRICGLRPCCILLCG
jgi:hypothetical protein